MAAKYQLFFINFVLLLQLGICISPEKGRNASGSSLRAQKKVVQSKNFTGKKIPVLCYHAIRETQTKDSPSQKTYSVSPSNFAIQIKALADNGYKSITPEDLKEYYLTNRSLPEKPVIITFDDGSKGQYDIGVPILDQYHFKGVFFIMTVAIGKPHYMSREQIKALADKGHIIGCHTWDHHKVSSFKKKDWQLQLAKPKKLLEKITQKPVSCFAYPYGVWNMEAVDSLINNDFSTAFIFYGKQDPSLPLYTIERIVVKNSGRINDFLNMIEKDRKL